MANPAPVDFLIAASLLNVDTVQELTPSAQLWIDHEDARARSAVSRGYYGAFRVLKAALIPRRVEWRRDPRRFPQRGVHEAMKRALEAALTDKHALVREMKGLLRKRNRCDYEFAPALTSEEADSDLAAAESAIGLIRKLTDEELDVIALELHKISA